MKKKMTLLAVGLFAGVMYGNQVIWSITPALSDDSGLKSSTAYLIDVATLARPTFTSDADARTWYAANKDSLASSSLMTATITDGSLNKVEIIRTLTGRHTYYTILVSSDENYLGSATLTKAMTMGDNENNSAASWSNKQFNVYSLSDAPTPPDTPDTDTPEPTSGVLMLVGAAMVALKRKQR